MYKSTKIKNEYVKKYLVEVIRVRDNNIMIY